VKPEEALAAKREVRETIGKPARDPVIEALLAPRSNREKPRAGVCPGRALAKGLAPSACGGVKRAGAEVRGQSAASRGGILIQVLPLKP